MERIYFTGANAKLSAVLLGDREKPKLIAIHGLRDHGLGMYELLQPLAAHYCVVALDLRGHGHSEKVATYTMIQFMADVKALFAHLGVDHAVLVAHSLGGHIATRFAATFPNMVDQLILLDGMGPPGIQDGIDPGHVQGRWRQGIETVTGINGERRSIPDLDEAKARLKRNNPLISPELLERVVSEGTEPHPDGGLRWRWESAVNMIWYTFSQAESEALIPLIPCPVLMVTGDRGLDYWVAMHADMNNPEFYAAELKRREALFQNGRHELVENAGHMLHYDQPIAVSKLILNFLNRVSGSRAIGALG